LFTDFNKRAIDLSMRKMPQRIRKISILLLAALLLIANFAADFAHDHDWRGGRDDDPAFLQSQDKPPVIESAQKLCIACLFANEHHSLPHNITLVINLPRLSLLAPPVFSFSSPFTHATYSNRAPPAEHQRS
jgi:hypothetical protein